VRAACPGILGIMLLDSSKKEANFAGIPCGRRGIFTRHDSVESLSKCIIAAFTKGDLGK